MTEQNKYDKLKELTKVTVTDGLIAYTGLASYTAFGFCVALLAYKSNSTLAISAAVFYGAFKIMGYITQRTLNERYKKIEESIIQELFNTPSDKDKIQ